MNTAELAFAAIVYVYIGSVVLLALTQLALRVAAYIEDLSRDVEQLELERAA